MSKRRLMIVSQSEINTFRTCRQRWHYKYGLGVHRADSTPAMRAGTLAHKCLQAIAMTMSAPTVQDKDVLMLAHFALDNVIANEISAMGHAAHADALETCALVDDMVRRYIAKYAREDHARYEVVSVETPYRARIASGVHDVMRVDLLLRDRRTRELVLMEHKTIDGDASRLDARLDVDPQTPGYLFALGRAHKGEEVGRVILNVLRRKAPSEPHVLLLKKAGKTAPMQCVTPVCEEHLLALQGDGIDRPKSPQGLVSVAACDTTRAVYLAALARQGARGVMVTAEQIAFSDTLPATDEKWLTRHEWFYTQREIDRWQSDTLADVKLIRMVQSGKLAPSRNGAACFPQNAMRCDHRELCTMDVSDPVAHVNGSPESGFVIKDQSIEVRISRMLDEQGAELDVV